MRSTSRAATSTRGITNDAQHNGASCRRTSRRRQHVGNQPRLRSLAAAHCCVTNQAPGFADRFRQQLVELQQGAGLDEPPGAAHGNEAPQQGPPQESEKGLIMEKPKNMTPIQELAWKEKKHAYDKAYRESNKEKIAAIKKANYEANRDMVLEKAKAYRESNKERLSARKGRYRAYRENLSAGYVALTLGVPLPKCPPELIEMKRQQLLIHRSIKQLNNKLEKQNGNQ